MDIPVQPLAEWQPITAQTPEGKDLVIYPAPELNGPLLEYLKKGLIRLRPRKVHAGLWDQRSGVWIVLEAAGRRQYPPDLRQLRADLETRSVYATTGSLPSCFKGEAYIAYGYFPSGDSFFVDEIKPEWAILLGPMPAECPGFWAVPLLAWEGDRVLWQADGGGGDGIVGIGLERARLFAVKRMADQMFARYIPNPEEGGREKGVKWNRINMSQHQFTLLNLYLTEEFRRFKSQEDFNNEMMTAVPNGAQPSKFKTTDIQGITLGAGVANIPLEWKGEMRMLFPLQRRGRASSLSVQFSRLPHHLPAQCRVVVEGGHAGDLALAAFAYCNTRVFFDGIVSPGGHPGRIGLPSAPDGVFLGLVGEREQITQIVAADGAFWGLWEKGDQADRITLGWEKFECLCDTEQVAKQGRWRKMEAFKHRESAEQLLRLSGGESLNL